MMRKFVLPALLGLAILPGCAQEPATPGKWQPSQQQKDAVIALANSYFEARDSQNHTDAAAMMTPAVQARMDLSQLSSMLADEVERYGQVTQRRIASVSWYPNGSKEGTGVAAGVDFQARTEGKGILCGYLAIIERTPGRFEILREDSTAFFPETVEKMQQKDRVALLNRPGCRVFLTR